MPPLAEIWQFLSFTEYFGGILENGNMLASPPVKSFNLIGLPCLPNRNLNLFLIFFYLYSTLTLTCSYLHRLHIPKIAVPLRASKKRQLCLKCAQVCAKILAQLLPRQK